MKRNTVFSHFYDSENINPVRREILRYMACNKESENEAKLIDEFLPIVKNAASPRGSFAFFELKKNDDSVFIEGTEIKSKSLSKNLKFCSKAIVFSLTLGLETDRLISKYSLKRPSAALCINAIATAMIEEYADVFCDEMKQEFKKEKLYPMPRFSPGYGDLSLENQSFFLKLTNASRLCGINLTDMFMMTPSKSITAIMGASDMDLSCIKQGCKLCNKTNCEFRR